MSEARQEECPGIVITLAEFPRDAHLDAAALGQLLCWHNKSIQRAVRRGVNYADTGNAVLIGRVSKISIPEGKLQRGAQ